MLKKCPFCETCNKNFESFGFDFPILKKLNVIGGGKRENAKCPKCFSIDRERLIYLYLSQFTKIFTDSLDVLHIAPEKRLREKIELNKNINYITADLYKNFVDINFDLCNIPLEDNSFDIIICNHVLEHIVEDKKAMKELKRILKPEGIAILQVPFSRLLEKTYENKTILSEKEREIHFGQNDHVRIYGIDYLKRLENIGFIVEEFKWTEHKEFTIEDYAINKEEPIFIVKNK